MNVVLLRVVKTAVVFAVILLANTLCAQNNIWTNFASEFWHNACNWSAGAPTNSQSALFITNATTKTLTINATTTASYPETLTISNLTLSGPSGTTNTLSLNNAGTNTPLHILNGFTIGSGGDLQMTNSALSVDGGVFSVDGTALLNSGLLTTPNVSTYIGNTGTGQMTISNGAWLAKDLYLGSSSFGSRGTLTIAGGTTTLSGSLYIAYNNGGPSAVWLTGGQLNTTNGSTIIGRDGLGQMTVSNGTWLAREVWIAYMWNPGTLTIAGGNVDLSLYLAIGQNAEGVVWLAGGQLNTTNGGTVIGYTAKGRMTVSGGVWQAQAVSVGANPGGQGTLTVAGGTNILSSYLNIANDRRATGTVWLTGGQLVTTNNYTRIGYNGMGQVTVTNGDWLAADVVVGWSNTTARGTLTIGGGAVQLASNLTVADYAGTTGTVCLTGGQFVVTNAPAYIGNFGIGQMIVSGGMWSAKDVIIAANAGSQGTLTIAGGTVSADNLIATNANSRFIFNAGTLTTKAATLDTPGALVVGDNDGSAIWTMTTGTHDIRDQFSLGNSTGSTGSVLLASGQLLTTNASVSVGNSGIGQMTISNGTWQAQTVIVAANTGSSGTFTIAGGTVIADNLIASNTNSRFIFNSGTLTTKAATLDTPGALVVGDNNGAATWTMTTGTHDIRDAFNLGNSAGSTGTVLLASGQLLTTNASVSIGNSGAGQMTVSGGVWQTQSINIAANTGSQGTLTIAGGTISADNLIATNANSRFVFNSGTLTTKAATLDTPDALVVGDNNGAASWTMTAGAHDIRDVLDLGENAGSTGCVWLTGGQLVTTNNNVCLGNYGIGQMTVSNGTWLAQEVYLGSYAGSQGTLTIAGGTNTLKSFLHIGYDATATGTVSLTGGRLITTDANMYLGDYGVGQMTVSNGTWLAQYVYVASRAGSQGTLTIAGGTANLEWLFAGWRSTGTVWLTGGQLITTNGAHIHAIGSQSGAVGLMTVSNGSWLASSVSVGSTDGSRGTLTIAGGSITMSGTLSVGSLNNTTGTVWLTGGQLVTANNPVNIGRNSGAQGQVTVSNGTWLAKDVYVGRYSGSQGTLTVAGGTVTLSAPLYLAFAPGSAGTAFLTGGQLTTTNGTAYIGRAGTGQMTVSDGTWLAADVIVAWTNNTARGTLTIAGGTVQLASSLTVAERPGSTGAVWLVGGQLIATNAPSTIANSGVGQMTVSGGTWQAQTINIAANPGSQGTLTIAGGTVSADNLIATNASSRFIFNTGTLTTKAATLIITGAVVVGDNNGLATWIMTGGAHTISNSLYLGNTAGATGVVWLTGGQLVTTNLNTCIGFYGTGRMTVTGGTWQARDVYVAGAPSAQGTLTIAGGAATFSSTLVIGNSGGTGTLWLLGGQLTTTNTWVEIGHYASGQMTVSNGTWLAREVTVGSGAGAQGTLTIAGGTNCVSRVFQIASDATPRTATGTVWLTSGLLVTTNSISTAIGTLGIGQMTVTGGNWLAKDISVGVGAGSQGTLTIAGGTSSLSSNLTIGYATGSTGAVWLVGGQLITTNGTATIANSGLGQMTISNGTWLAKDVVVGANDGSRGTLTLAGGSFSVINGLTVRNNATLTGAGTITGAATLANGATLAPGNSVSTLNVVGTLSLASGALLRFDLGPLGVNDLVNVTGNLTVGGLLNITDIGGLTNGAYVLFTYGGNLITNSLIRIEPLAGDLTATLDYGSGSNSNITLLTTTGADPYVEFGYYYFGTTNSFGAKTADGDGDGMTNEQEMLAGTDPTDNQSVMRIVSLTLVGNDVIIRWQTSGGDPVFSSAPKTNIVEYSDNVSGGFTNTLAIVVTSGTGDQFTNVTDTAAASAPRRFYRVRLLH